MSSESSQHVLIREKTDRFIKLCSTMREWYDSRVALLPYIKDFLKNKFVSGVDDIIYKYTEPTLAKIKPKLCFGEVEETFEMFDIKLAYYRGLTYNGSVEHYVIYWSCVGNEEIIIVYDDKSLQVPVTRQYKPALDEVYNYIVKQMRPR